MTTKCQIQEGAAGPNATKEKIFLSTTLRSPVVLGLVRAQGCRVGQNGAYRIDLLCEPILRLFDPFKRCQNACCVAHLAFLSFLKGSVPITRIHASLRSYGHIGLSAESSDREHAERKAECRTCCCFCFARIAISLLSSLPRFDGLKPE